MLLARFDSKPSTVSLPSSASSYITSSSSFSTIPGPGALTGKALKALGKTTLRGFDRLVIARHLATITSLFPHTDEQASRIKHIDDIYDDLLEFSRPGMYNKGIFEKALGFILTQIGTGHTRYLVTALIRWHIIELQILLAEILNQLAPLWNPSAQHPFSLLFYSLYTPQLLSEPTPIPLILFFSKLIRAGHRVCQVVLDVGFLDILLHIHPTHPFHPKPSKSGRLHYHKHLLIVCNAALFDITGYPEYRSLVLHHPICSEWYNQLKTRPPDIIPFTTRQKSLLLDTERDAALSDYSPYLNISLIDICSERCVSAMQANQLLHSLSFGVNHDQATRVYLVRSTHEEQVRFLSRLINCMPKSIDPPMTVEDPTINDPFRWRYQLLFCLHFIGVIAQTIPNGQWALADAGAINYLVYILQKEAPDSHFTTLISDAEPIDIPNIVQERGLVDFLHKQASLRLERSVYRALVTLFNDITAFRAVFVETSLHTLSLLSRIQS